MIPKQIHFVWIGDAARMPIRCIETWRRRNPDYAVRVWNNQDLLGRHWRNQAQLDQMLAKRDYAGATDIMRYEILHDEGGLALDADSYCLKSLEPWLLECDAFACWEQELVRTNLIANGYMGSVPGAEVTRFCIEEVGKRDCSRPELAWMLTGPLLLTQVYFNRQPNLTVYPSHFFIQDHHTGFRTRVTGHHFANQMWGSSIGYEAMDECLSERHAGC